MIKLLPAGGSHWVLSLSLLFSTCGLAQSIAPAGTDIHQRAQDLLKRMTLDEKVGQLNQISGTPRKNTNVRNLDEAIRSGQVSSILWLNNKTEINRLQHLAIEGTRLHIPLLVGLDVIHGYSTVFPVPLAMASSWDPPLVEAAQHVAAQEARTAGINWIFTPMVDIVRDARWGRIVESAGEDPYLGSAMAVAQIKGLQGETWGPDSTLASVKHFAGYGAEEGGRALDSSDIPESLLRNVYLKPFHAAAMAGVGSFMSAYMDLNDVPASGNRWLLHDVLREEWGYRGFVVSDASAVRDLTAHGYAANPEDAAYKALSAGLNMDMASNIFISNLPKLIATGKITEAQLDEAVLPIIEAKIQLGLFERPYASSSNPKTMLGSSSSRELARNAAARTMVLLRNEDHTLPLDHHLQKIALIGPFVNSTSDLEGSWTVKWPSGAESSKAHTVTIAGGLRNKLGEGVQIETVTGPELQRIYVDSADTQGQPGQPMVESDLNYTPSEVKKWQDRAVAAASSADVVIAVMGEAADMTGEKSGGRATLDLPGIQEQMLEAVAATHKPVVLVLVSGRPLDIRWPSRHVPAILEAWYPGSEGGNAIADVLFGDVNPGAKLPVTWPLSVGQEPIYYNHNLTNKPDYQPDFTSRYWDMPTKPLYPFGYGLSYSSFTFSNLRFDHDHIKAGETAHLQVDVANSCQIAGDSVVQIYIHQRAGSASRPERQLEGFQRITLKPGESRTLEFALGDEELSFWSEKRRAWGVEPGTFDVWAGGDSTATLHAELQVTP